MSPDRRLDMADVVDKDMGYEKFRQTMESFGQRFVKVGLPEDGTVGEGKDKGSGHKPAESMSELIKIGAVHEFGAPNRNIPERSWLRSAFDKNAKRIDRQLDNAVGSVIDGTADEDRALGLVGEWFVNVVKAHIGKMKLPALQDRTVKRKGSSALLVDIGQMRNSIQWVLGRF